MQGLRPEGFGRVLQPPRRARGVEDSGRSGKSAGLRGRGLRGPPFVGFRRPELGVGHGAGSREGREAAAHREAPAARHAVLARC